MTRLAEQEPAAADRALAAAEVEAEAVLTPPPAAVAAMLRDDEVVLLVTQPSLWFALFSCAGTLLVLACVTLAMAWLAQFPGVPWSDHHAFLLGALAVAARLGVSVLDWASRVYVLTDRRLLRRRGIIRVSVLEAPLRNIQNSVVFVQARERVLGLGSLGFATLGADTFNLWWETIRQPVAVHRMVQDAIERYGRR